MLVSERPLAPTQRYPRFPGHVPTGIFEHGRYRARFARSPAELDEILRLRFEVFNVELAEGLDSSWEEGRDEDVYDQTCHHLLVEEKASGRIIGTYRLQTAVMAAAGSGFYSAGEYDLSGIPSHILTDSVELGRACIAPEFRNRYVLFLLWRGLARYLQVNEKRYFLGCCSLPSQEPAEGWRLWHQLRESGHVLEEIRVEPLPELWCDPGGPRGEDREAPGPVDLPILFRTYLRYGVKVCGTPAIDRQFKTIDYLVLFDWEALDPRSQRLFAGSAQDGTSA